ncbi:unnamed protein product [Prorocentrum cordatum]|uniref:Uncharacterized protein n=1 Tax=Prorocentrum cordatum TaxID=2364126 RepID=A0ABN9W321_9DINO|nr:unnamed protein product [Polarella glacialis]
MAPLPRLALLSRLVLEGASALGLAAEQGASSSAAELLAAKHLHAGQGASALRLQAGSGGRAGVLQTPEELGFSGDAGDTESDGESQFGENFCLDIGAKGFPIPTQKMLQAVDWDAAAYFAQLQGAGYAEDALQMTGPDAAMLKSDCMKERGHGRVKHIFVGDSQMMSLRNAFHRLNKCPEIWWSKNDTRFIDDMMVAVRRNEKDGPKMKSRARFHSHSQQTPNVTEMPHGCTEGGIASFIHWDGWVSHQLPVKEIKREMELLGVDPAEGDTIVVWVGSNFIPASHRMSALLESINKLHELKVKMVWDSPTFHDEVIMAATTTYDGGRDPRTNIPIAFNSILQRKLKGRMGSNQYRTEKELFQQGIEVPTTKRWQISNRYRGLQCDGIHSDMRARDPLFFDMPCPMGQQKYGQSTYCAWVEPFKKELSGMCPVANGLDDLVLQSGLYAMCAAHEEPFCYMHTELIR